MYRFLFLLLASMLFSGLNAQTAYEPKTIPVTFTYRESMMNPGSYTCIFRNDSQNPITISVEFDRPSTKQSKSIVVTLPSLGKKEISEAEGWSGVSDDTITITCNGGYGRSVSKIP